MPKYIGILYDQGGNTWVETCEAEDDIAAQEILERNDSNLMLFTVEEIAELRCKIREKLGTECMKCGGPLEKRKFIDSWDAKDNPVDINEDLYCPKCNIRWLEEGAPHEFLIP